MPAHHPVPVPDFLYGTAWKEDRTQALTELAVWMGFQGIDTANQRRHYFEAGVGQGLARRSARAHQLDPPALECRDQAHQLERRLL